MRDFVRSGRAEIKRKDQPVGPWKNAGLGMTTETPRKVPFHSSKKKADQT